MPHNESNTRSDTGLILMNSENIPARFCVSGRWPKLDVNREVKGASGSLERG
jgi:hypothetical protein